MENGLVNIHGEEISRKGVVRIAAQDLAQQSAGGGCLAEAQPRLCFQ